jgi:hypothetical protein
MAIDYVTKRASDRITYSATQAATFVDLVIFIHRLIPRGIKIEVIKIDSLPRRYRVFALSVIVITTGISLSKGGIKNSVLNLNNLN